MAYNTKVISADAHIIEPPDLWTSRLDKRFKERAPRVVHEAETDRWVSEDAALPAITDLVGINRPLGSTQTTGRYGLDILQGGYDPEVRLRDMNRDGVYGEVLYPTVGLRLFMVKDIELQKALFATYNTWLANFCRTHPERYKGIGMICVDDIEGAVQELHRCKELGLSGGMIGMEQSEYELPKYDPIWAAAEQLGMPLNMHTGTGRGPRNRTRIDFVVYSVHMQRVLAAMIYSGIFDRFPKLKVVSVEAEAGWASSFLERMDYFYDLHGEKRKARGIFCERPPSEILRQHIGYTFIFDYTGIVARKVIGENALMWSSDFPHGGSTWPDSQKVIAEQLAGVPESDAQKIIWGNAAALYGF